MVLWLLYYTEHDEKLIINKLGLNVVKGRYISGVYSNTITALS